MRDSDRWLEISTGYCVLRVQAEMVEEMHDFLTSTVLTEWLWQFGQVVIGFGDLRGVLEEDTDSEDWIWHPQNGKERIWKGENILSFILGE